MNKSIMIRNKDYLILSLLDYICKMHKKEDMLDIIYEYLKRNDIIDTDNINFFQNNNNMNDNIIGTIFGVENNEICKSKIFYSRYSDDFIEQRKIGTGGFGSVYESFHKIDKQSYAIKKIIIDDLTKHDSSFYLHEVQNLAKLSHKNIVRYYGTWIEFTEVNKREDELLLDIDSNSNKEIVVYEDYENIDIVHVPVLYIQMELCISTLNDYLIKRNYEDREIDILEEIKKFRQLVAGVKHIHKHNIIHGDLNPKNIFIDHNGVFKIGDFGLSKMEEDELIYNSSYGNPLYMPPEKEERTCLTDIYSLGIILFELLYKFKTGMERFMKITELKKNSDDIIINNNTKDYTTLIKEMIKKENRCNIEFIENYLKK